MSISIYNGEEKLLVILQSDLGACYRLRLKSSVSGRNHVLCGLPAALVTAVLTGPHFFH